VAILGLRGDGVGLAVIVVLNVLRLAPLLLLGAVSLQELGWWRAGVVLLVYRELPRAWYLGLPLALAGHIWLDIPYRYLFWAVTLRLVWDLGLGAVGRRIRARGNRIQLPPVEPRLRCKHGLGPRIETAAGLSRRGLDDAAVDAYLEILADHPEQVTCRRLLLLRTAEASRSAGDHDLAVELSAAAERGLPQDPIGKDATLAVRAEATRAGALARQGDHVEAARAIRTAQRLTQGSRATERYLRWAAAEVRLSTREVCTSVDFAGEIAAALTEQHLSLRMTSELTELKIAMAWRLLAAGEAQGAASAFTSVLQDLDLDPVAAGVRGPDGSVQVPVKWQSTWRLFTLAVAGVLAADAARGEGLSADALANAELAVDLAPYFGQNLTGARMLLNWALADSHRGHAKDAIAKLRRAQGCADRYLHTFADRRRQLEWVRLRQDIADALQSVSGVVEALISSPWPVVGEGREQAERARAKADDLFERLAATDPAFGAARSRVPARLDAGWAHGPGGSLLGPPLDHAIGPRDNPPARLKAQSSLPPRMPDRAASLPTDPDWLEPLMAATGSRCWTLMLAVDQARALGHGHVGPEHLLLAVSRDGGCAAILDGLGVPADDLRVVVSSWYSRTSPAVPVLDPKLPALARDAATIAASLGESRVLAGHLLVALLADPRGAGGAVLRACGGDLEEARLRVDAAIAGPALKARAGALFSAGGVVQLQRLTLPAWLAIGWALDFAALEPGRILGLEHLEAGIEAYGAKAMPPFAANDRATVRIHSHIREVLKAARHSASADGEWGIDLHHLGRAIRREESEGNHRGKVSTKNACARAARRGSLFVTPEDIREALLNDPVGQVFPPVPVLTPAARRAWGHVRSSS